jgi:hypothetical protein
MIKELASNAFLQLWKRAAFLKSGEASNAFQCATCFFLIILYSSYLAYDRSSYFLDDFYGSGMCSRIDFSRTILLAVPPSSRRHGFWTQCPRTGSRVWPQPLALIPCSLHHSTSFSCYRLDAFINRGVRCLVHIFPPGARQPRLRMSARVDFLDVLPSDPSEEGGIGLCPHLCAEV